MGLKLNKKGNFKIKNLFKSRVFFFVLGIFLTSVVGVSAASVLYSKDVTYDNSSSGLSATTVQEALDELYEQTKNLIPEDYMNMKGRIVEIVTSNSGLYIDTSESGRYIYRGENPNNYITFNNETWRIISVESDGTLKIIKKESIGSYSFDSLENRTVSGYCDSSYGCNSWGSSSTTLNSEGISVTKMPRTYGGSLYDLPSNEATLNTYLNGDYYNSLASSAKKNIVSHTFNIGVTIGSNNNLQEDIQKESSYKWKGKIALMNLSDYVRASINSSCTGTAKLRASISNCSNNWMRNFGGWALAPEEGTTNIALYFSGSLWRSGVSSSYSVHPVLHLSSSITLSGSGTESVPYIIK